MTIEVLINESASPVTSEAVYLIDDYALVYSHERVADRKPLRIDAQIEDAVGIGGIPDSLVIADTLVVRFAGESQELVAFDAYTNCARWRRINVDEVPRVAGVGAVCLGRPLPEGQIDLHVSPVYTYSEKGGLLQIQLADAVGTVWWYRVSDRLLVGVHSGKLASLLVLGLKHA